MDYMQEFANLQFNNYSLLQEKNKKGIFLKNNTYEIKLKILIQLKLR